MTTTIAGFAGEGSQDSSSFCRTALEGLSLFGGHPEIRNLGPATFGSMATDARSGSARSPVVSPAHLCVLDGRIDNAGALSVELGIPPGSADNAVFSAAWSRWGPSTVDRLIGDYAFAVFDRQDGQTWLGRDPGGYRPLHFCSFGGVLGFSSMPSGLMSAFGIEEPDLSTLARYVDFRPKPPCATFWRQIQQIPPGSIWRFRQGRASGRNFLNPPAPMRRAHDWNELIEEMRYRLDCAVARNIAGQSPPIGAHLSSGLDSSAIVSTAAQMVGEGQKLIVLTAAPRPGARLLVPRGRFADESALAAETAKMCGAEHLIVRNSERFLPAVRGTAAYFQQPAPAQFSFPWWRETAQIVHQRGGSVLLTAGQGNATLSYGGLQTLPRYLAQGRVREWWREMRAIIRNEDVRMRGLIFNSAQPLIPKRLSTRLLRSVKGQPLRTRSFVRKEWVHMPDPSLDPSSDYLAGRLDMLRGFDAGWRTRGMFALTGVEERDPCADRELIEFSLSLPPEAHLGTGRIKPLIRDALADRLPPSILENRQRGVSGADWYDRIGPADCREAMDEIRASPNASQLLDLAALDRAIEDWPAFNPSREGVLSDFGRRIARALSTGLFLAEVDRYPLAKPRQ